jgi:hypothetical protein
MSLKDYTEMNKILDPLKAISIIEDVLLGKPSLVASLAFIA